MCRSVVSLCIACVGLLLYVMTTNSQWYICEVLHYYIRTYTIVCSKAEVSFGGFLMCIECS